MNKFSQIFFKRSLVFIHDLLMIPLAWYLAYWFRYNLATIPSDKLITATHVLPLVMALQFAAYWFFGLYRGVWRFASIPDLLRIIKSVALAVAALALCLFLYDRLDNIPRSILLIHAVALILLLGGSRFIYRWFKDYSGIIFTGKRVLIVGSEKEAEALVRSFRREGNGEYRAMAFIDDDFSRQGMEIQGVRVVGRYDDLNKVVEKLKIDLVVIAAPHVSSAIMRRLIEVCEHMQVDYRVLPTISQITSGQVNIAELREVALEDLLGREAVKLDWRNISQTIEDQVVLVSGGGGSIGSELSRQVSNLQPKKLIVVENNEFNLYSIEMELKEKYPNMEFVAYLADVTDVTSIERIFEKQKPTIVFHAAAYKHVPLLEKQIDAAVHNNILGTANMAKTALKYEAKKFVLISTDKAVNPTNAMGASKRIAEILCQNLAKLNKTEFITVRFGNVLGSRGSVIPLFRQQLEKGGPITVTHPDIERFFMTIPEASQLILQAAALGKGGEIFVLDMGQPIKITYLAEQLIKLAGKKVGEDIEIVFTGLRPGEKLYEELFHDGEQRDPTSHEKIFRSTSREVLSVEFEKQYNELIHACLEKDQQHLKQLLKKIVPEYQFSN